jgi:8-oxo-dGTP pyrophosphatase MutT (NUDIX family)
VKPPATWSVDDMNPGLKDQPKPPYHPSQRRPRDAATLILLDRSGPAPKVLLGRRHQNHVFMPGLHVFPGGKVEAADARAPASGRLPDHVELRLQKSVLRPSPARARAYALAAIRELAEETGFMLGAKTGTRPAGLNGVWKPFAECGVTPSLDDLWLVARSITPTGLVRRYDTRFFAADANRVCHTIEGIVHPQAELVDLQWCRIGETFDLALHPITRFVLTELAARIEAGIERDLPVPFFRPRSGVMHRLEI